MKRSVIVVIAAMTAMLMLVSCSSKVEKLITEAETALYSGNYEDVVELCNEVIEADDDNQTAYYFRGCAYYELGNYNDAVDDCEKAVSFGKAEAYTHLWKSYMKLDDMVNTEKYLKESLDAGNTDVETYTTLIGIYEDQKEFKKARDTKLEAYEKTGDETFKIIAVSEETAKEKEGIYVLSDGMFYPLQECIEDRIRGYFVMNYDMPCTMHLTFSYPTIESIPYLCKNDKLVLFSYSDLEEDCCRIGKVSKQGYTIPVEFDDSNSDVKGKEFSFIEFGAEETSLYDANTTKVTGSSIYDIEDINGMTYNQFHKKHALKKSCSKEKWVCRSDYEEFVDLEYDEEVTFTYRQGSGLEKESMRADIKYYWYDMDNARARKIELSDKPYAEIDISDLDKGTYVIRWMNDSEYNNYDLKGYGIYTERKYIFTVGE